jgi:ribosomal protein S6--L-glutamate ligase
MKSFGKHLAEQDSSTPKPYRFVYLWFDDPDDPDDPESTADDFISEGEKLGLKGYKVDVSGAYSELDSGGKRFIYGKDDDKGFLVDENTIVFVRAPVTRRKSWMDLLTQLERGGVCCVNNRHCMESTSDKYRTSLILAENGLNQPKTVLIHHQDRALDAFDRMKSKYPIILKTLTGSLGVGVVKIETEESLSATTQLLYKLDPNMGVLLQDFIVADYDVRAHVVAGKFYGAIKRPIVKKDFRSNVALGSKPEALTLTKLEIDHCIQAAKAVDGLWVGVDFIPAKNREKDSPIFIEINSTPGTKGYKKATKENIAKDILTTFKDRTTWLKTQPFTSIYDKG